MPTPRTTRAVDTGLIRELAELLEEAGLSEIDVAKGDFRVRLSRAVAPTMVAAPTIPGGTPTLGSARAEEVAAADQPGVLASPMVGVVYTSPEPGTPPFVNVGDTVAAGDTVLLIEAMKVFNPIQAPHAGRIARVFVANGVPVEYGEPLMIIE